MPLKNNRLNHQIGQAVIGVSRKFLDNSPMFLVHPTLSETEITKTCAVLKEICMKASL